MKAVPKQIMHEGEVVTIYFDLTLVVSKDNEIVVIDNNEQDYTDFVDANTLIVQQVKIPIV